MSAVSQDDGAQPMVIMGIDPGSAVTGFGLIQSTSSGWEILHQGCVRAVRTEALANKLGRIYAALMDVIREYQPDLVVVERGFSGQNPHTAMVMGQVLGISLLVATNASLPVSEYSPREVKLAVTGFGSASKEQVQYMVKQLLGIEEVRLAQDASDALAVALCHANKLDLPD
jgi:crossover junction endodeoxyribonuclease RuvC